MRVFLLVLSGALFGIGLGVGGMTQPAKVLGFLDVAGHWDPSLLFVMGGAVTVYLFGHRALLARRTRPLCAARFDLPSKKSVDARLIAGAVLFGVGWGIAGFCPGPGLASLGALSLPGAIFVGFLFAGFLLERAFDSVVSGRRGA